MRLAVFSDVDANIQGLQAVLHDIAERGADLVGYGASPGAVIDLMRDQAIPTVMGNYDDAIGYHRIACGCDYPDAAAMERGLRSIGWTQAHVDERQKGYLRNLPYRLQREIAGHQVVLVHASPAELNEYLFESTDEAVFRQHLAVTGADVLLFGHTHRPFHRVVDSKHLVNTGSAGKPKHGTPEATYALLQFTPTDVKVEIIRVPYDHEAAALAIEATELPP